MNPTKRKNNTKLFVQIDTFENFIATYRASIPETSNLFPKLNKRKIIFTLSTFLRTNSGNFT